ncbi:MAG: FeoA family protein, partial [bacterium]
NELSEIYTVTLDQIKINQSVIVQRINGGYGVRNRLNTMGIHKGDNLTVKRSGIMRGPILVNIHGMDVALGRGMARKIVVSKERE